MKNAISIIHSWIFDSNYEHALCMTRESLDIGCSHSVLEEKVENFETVFYDVRYMWAPGNIKMDKHEGVTK